MEFIPLCFVIEGMQTGDTDSAIWAICHYLLIGFHSGRPLPALEADCGVYVEQGKELKREQQVGYITLIWQTVLNLRIHADNPVRLTGEVMDQDKCISVANSTGNPVLSAWVDALRMQLCAIFGEHETGAQLALTFGDRLGKIAPGSPHAAFDPFFRAICLFSMARITKQNNFKAHALKVAATIKSWVKKGNPNLRQLDAILDAEKAALESRIKSARKHYHEAIVMSAKCGFVHHAALANERYGEFALHVMKDREEASYRFKEAIKYYSDWGSRTKVDMLQERYSYLLV